MALLALSTASGCVDRAIHFRADGSGAGGQDDGALDDGASSDDGDSAEDVGGNHPTVPPCVPGPDTDCDGDGVPDGDDPFPDGDDPPPASDQLLYANTPGELYGVHPDELIPQLVAPFSFADGGGENITDIAIDRYGYLYAVGTSTLYACDPQTVVCTELDAVPGVNAAGFARTDAGDVLLLAGFDGTVWRVDFDGQGANAVAIGNYGVGGSAGDIAGNADVTVASINLDTGWEEIRRVRPSTGAADVETYPFAPVSQAWGLAFYGERLFAFTAGGDLVVEEAGVPLYFETGLEFWGAASVPDW